MSDIPQVQLNDQTSLPTIGFGTNPMKGPAAVTAIRQALDAGYRLLDSAVNYDNEEEVGEAIRTSGIDRSEIRVTTKVAGRHHAHDLAVQSVRDSLERMGLDQLDLVLIHWPNPSVGRYVEAWQALVDCREQGLVSSIGVSNFTGEHLEEVVEATGVTPAVNQIEVHPSFPQQEMLAVNDDLGIVTQAWSPLGKRRSPTDAEPIAAASRAHGVSPQQVMLRWHVQRGVIPLPKAANPDHQVANLDIFGFTLDDDEVAAITALGRPDGRLFGGDPTTHEEM